MVRTFLMKVFQFSFEKVNHYEKKSVVEAIGRKIKIIQLFTRNLKKYKMKYCVPGHFMQGTKLSNILCINTYLG